MSVHRLRDDRVDLGRMAREFDQISRGEHRPATRFVEWLADEWRATAEPNVTGAERREVGEAA